MTSRNEITGDMIVSRASNQDAYAANYDNIFRKNKSTAWKLANGSEIEFSPTHGNENIVTCCGGCGSGICETKIIDFEYYREEDEEGNLVESRTEPKIVSKCCGGDVFYWDVEKDEEVV